MARQPDAADPGEASATRPTLEQLAQRLEARARWEDLVLPVSQIAVLAELAAHVRHATTVYREWGFEDKSHRGHGVSALFSGPSGTGKTMAAEALANELILPLYRIDLASVVSKFVGETEKSLDRVFDAPGASEAVLFFDEADALFSRRGEVRDSHDRYANLETSYLLQRVEDHHGVAVLASNRRTGVDEAVMRRLDFVVSFPFPGREQRRSIWEKVFPEQTPRQQLDVEALARLHITGGMIRNIALRAAFLASEAGEPVSMAHIWHAANREQEGHPEAP